MGMYTELILGIEFKDDTPKYIIEAIDCLINKSNKGIISDEAQNFIKIKVKKNFTSLA